MTSEAPVKEQVETRSFEADVPQLMDLVANALYTEREIFVRELVSNSADAMEKLRQLALSDEALLESDTELKIAIAFDKELKTVTITDNGLGMDREDIVANLGTVASSGTKKFLKSLTGDAKKDAQLIGQFGVGFYSAFVVAEKVVVKSRRAGMQSDQGVYWESDGVSEYEIKNIDREARGTEVTLYLKDDAAEFADFWRLKNTITKYSNHVQWPIFMQKATTDKDGKETGEFEDEQVNEATALWVKPKKDLKDEDYKKFYTTVSGHDYQDPLTWAHNRVEGKLEYISLLYIPQKAPFDLYYREQQRGLKLYIRRVFIMDDAEQLLPMYLRFVKGVVDSNDLPLNVSREMLQSNRTIDAMRSGCVKRVLSMLEGMAKKEDSDKYETFWTEFGSVLKEGMAEDFANKDRIAKLLRFASTHSGEAKQDVSLESYVSRMQEGQDKIYYLIAESHQAAMSSPHLEIFKKKGIEVLILSDRVDEWLVSHMTEFDGKNLQSVAKGDLSLDKEEEEANKDVLEEQKKDFESVMKQMQEVLKEQVKEVRLTSRLVDSPACLVSEDDQMSSHLQRMMRDAGQEVPETQPIMEINAEHGMIAKLKDEPDDARFGDLAHVIFDQALLAEGGKLKDPAKFVQRLNALLVEAL